jgi:hypothetical protein
MIFALELSDNVDPTALATVALAILTLAVVVVGIRALRQTRNEIDLSRQEVEEAQRPVVVRVIDKTTVMQIWGESPLPMSPYFAGGGLLYVPLRNIGSGPALDVEVSLIHRNDAGRFSELSGDTKYNGRRVAGLGVSDVAPIEIRIGKLDGLPSFDVRVVYRDVARKRWVTTAKYLAPDGGRYDELSIDALDV